MLLINPEDETKLNKLTTSYGKSVNWIYNTLGKIEIVSATVENLDYGKGLVISAYRNGFNKTLTALKEKVYLMGPSVVVNSMNSLYSKINSRTIKKNSTVLNVQMLKVAGSKEEGG